MAVASDAYVAGILDACLQVYTPKGRGASVSLKCKTPEHFKVVTDRFQPAKVTTSLNPASGISSAVALYDANTAHPLLLFAADNCNIVDERAKRVLSGKIVEKVVEWMDTTDTLDLTDEWLAGLFDILGSIKVTAAKPAKEVVDAEEADAVGGSKEKPKKKRRVAGGSVEKKVVRLTLPISLRGILKHIAAALDGVKWKEGACYVEIKGDALHTFIEVVPCKYFGAKAALP